MKHIVIATHNKAKIRDLMSGFRQLEKHGFTLHTLEELHITAEPEETGKTFEENSLLKAQYYAELCNMAAIADDGGLTIDALHGEPGVYSRRWTGAESTDEVLIAYTLKRMKGIPDENRTAQMQTCLCYYDPQTGKHILIREKVDGHITEEANPGWTRGYPYRAVFTVDRFHKFYDDLTEEEHAQINHRFMAIDKLSKAIIDSHS